MECKKINQFINLKLFSYFGTIYKYLKRLISRKINKYQWTLKIFSKEENVNKILRNKYWLENGKLILQFILNVPKFVLIYFIMTFRVLVN